MAKKYLHKAEAKNIVEILGKEGSWTQKPPKVVDLGTKQGNQVHRRSCQCQTTLEEEAGAGTVPHAPTWAVHVDMV